MSTWIKFPCDYWTQPRMLKLRRLLKHDALWVPARVWTFAATQDGSGSLSGYEPDELADLIGYTRNAGKMAAALKECGYVDQDGMIIGWPELYSLAASRASSAKKAAEARWGRPPGPPDPNPETEIEREREAHALRGGMRDAHPHTPQNASLSLTETNRTEVSTEFGLTIDGVHEAEKVFRQNKANYPQDPQTLDAFKGWLRTSRDGRGIVKKFSVLSAVRSQQQQAIPEPPRRREWLRLKRPGSSLVDDDWPRIDATAQAFIVKAMEEEPLPPPEPNSRQFAGSGGLYADITDK